LRPKNLRFTERWFKAYQQALRPFLKSEPVRMQIGAE
jgi:hypothetical protein